MSLYVIKLKITSHDIKCGIVFSYESACFLTLTCKPLALPVICYYFMVDVGTPGTEKFMHPEIEEMQQLHPSDHSSSHRWHPYEHVEPSRNHLWLQAHA